MIKSGIVRRSILVWLGLVLAHLPASAQADRLKFSHIDINNGLSHNQVNCFLRDSKGFMWIGTMSGLNRFDGYSFKVFRNSVADTASITDNYVNKLFEDPVGRIWVSTNYGGPLAKEPMMKTKFVLHDAKLHVDHMHRGPAQIYPAVRQGMFDAMKKGGAIVLEPIQTHLIEVPVEFMGAVTQLVGSKRGILIDVQQEGIDTFIKSRIPVSEMIGWSSDLRSSTEGRGVSSLVDQEFQKLPNELQTNVIRKIRERKGLAENQ